MMRRQLGCIAGLFFAGLLSSLPQGVSAQEQTVAVHFTLSGWADDTWLYLEDRDAVEDGRLSSNGILQRFHKRIDSEYELDQISNAFSPVTEFAWQQRSNGLRWQGGSINRRELIAQTDVKVLVAIGGSWTAIARVNNKDSPILNRHLLRVTLRRTWPSGLYAFAEGSFHQIKPSSDISVGGGFASDDLNIVGAFVILDAFNGIVSQLLTQANSSFVTAIEHDKQPTAVRTSFTARMGRHTRAEIHAAALLPTAIRAFARAAPDSGFTQDETFAYLGILAEWSPVPILSVGAFLKHSRSGLDRQALPRGLAENTFRLRQSTSQVGVVALWHPLPRWLVQNRIWRSWRPESRTFASDSFPPVDWEDRAWSGRSDVTYAAPGGFTAGTGFEYDLRTVVRGNPVGMALTPDAHGQLVGIGDVPSLEFLGRDHTRVRFEIGWRFLPGRHFTIGFRLDVDADNYGGKNSRFDGAHGRFEFSW